LLSRCPLNSELRGGGFAPRHLNRWASSRRYGLKFVMQRFKFLFACLTITIIGLLSYVVFAQTKLENPPAVVSAVAPVYPAVALALNLQGDFLVDVEIDRSGKVVSSKAVEGTHKVMRRLIELTAERWRFAPDESAEKRRHAQLTFTFRHMPKVASGLSF